MKAFYLSSTVELTDELRQRMRGHRVENAAAFNGVARGITEAEVIGDHPNITKALADAGIKTSGKPARFDVFKVVNGKQAKNASKHNLTLEDAETFVADNPDNEYNIVADEA